MDVDGMNVVGSRPDGWWRDRPAAMRRLVERLVAYAEATGDEVAVIFDGRPVEVESGPVEVAFARGGRGAADDEIAARAGPGVTVVTSDRELRRRAADAGADVVSVRAFEARIRAAPPTPP